MGVVEELGSEVTGLDVGQRVSGEGHIVCGRCRNCQAGRRHLLGRAYRCGRGNARLFPGVGSFPFFGVPLHTCGRDGSLNRTLASLRDIDLVLVDTAGVSPNGTDSLEPLRRRIARAGESVTVHLCVAAATRQEELDRILHVYGRLDPAALIATKLDEAVAIGSMYAGRTQADVPFSYVTTGQQVPDDFAPATPELLIDVLLGGDQS